VSLQNNDENRTDDALPGPLPAVVTDRLWTGVQRRSSVVSMESTATCSRPRFLDKTLLKIRENSADTTFVA
jgi:hypothetical protein